MKQTQLIRSLIKNQTAAQKKAEQAQKALREIAKNLADNEKQCQKLDMVLKSGAAAAGKKTKAVGKKTTKKATKKSATKKATTGAPKKMGRPRKNPVA